MSPRGPTVVFVAGSGRSGTTLLGDLLATHPEVLHVGELHYLWERSILEHRLCGCGQTVSDCRVWSQVVAICGPDTSRHRWAQEILLLQRRQFRTRHSLRSIPDSDHPYVAAVGCCIRAASEKTGRSIIVDTSKRSSHLLALVAAGLDVRVVNLVRDPAAVAFSWQRPKPEFTATGEVVTMASKGPVRSTLEWVAGYALPYIVSRRAKLLFSRISYEALSAAPGRVIDEALSALGLPPMNYQAALAMEGVSRNRSGFHAVAGNPGRFDSGRLEVRPDERWRDQLPALDRIVVRALTLGAGRARR